MAASQEVVEGPLVEFNHATPKIAMMTGSAHGFRRLLGYGKSPRNPQERHPRQPEKAANSVHFTIKTTCN
jgi:hypothetical protein